MHDISFMNRTTVIWLSWIIWLPLVKAALIVLLSLVVITLVKLLPLIITALIILLVLIVTALVLKLVGTIFLIICGGLLYCMFSKISSAGRTEGTVILYLGTAMFTCHM